MQPRTSVKSAENNAIEVLRNMREHLLWRGLVVRHSPASMAYQERLGREFIERHLAELEQSHPGICPGRYARGVPETGELLGRAVARRLEVPFPELGELYYCSDRAFAHFQHARAKPAAGRLAAQ